jgi:hypothetical protein
MDRANKRVVFHIVALVHRSILSAASRSLSGSRLRSSGLTFRRSRLRIIFFPFQIRGRAGFLPALTARRRLHQSRPGGAR